MNQMSSTTTHHNWPDLAPGVDPFAILQHMDDAVLAVDIELSVLFWNRACELFFGWSAAEALGCKTTELIDLRYVDGSDRNDLRAIFDAPDAVVREAILTRRDGSELWVETSCQVVRDGDGARPYIVAIVRDITVRQQARTAQTRLHIIAEASRLFASAVHEAHWLSTLIVEYLVTTLGDGCVMRLLSADGHSLLPGVAAHRDTDHAASLSVLTAVERGAHDVGISSRVLSTMQPLLLPHFDFANYRASVDDARLRILTLPDIHSLMMVPLMARGKVSGTLAVIRDATADAYTHDDLALLQNIAERAALSIDNAHLLAEAHKARAIAEADQQRLRVLAEASHQFSVAANDLSALFRAIAEYIAATIGDLCSLRLCSADGTHLIVAHTAHPDPVARELAAAIDPLPQRTNEGHTRVVLESGEPMLLNSIPHERFRAAVPSQFLPFIDQFGIDSLMIMPLKARDEVLGTLTVSRDRGHVPYTAADLTMCQEIADRAALAISAARAYADEQAARRAAERAIHDKAEAFALLDTLFATAPVGLAFVDRELRFARINASLAQLNGRAVAEHLGRHIGEVLPQIASRLIPIYERVLASGQPVLNEEISGETAAEPGVMRHWIASYYPVLGADQSPIGVGVVVIEISERIRAEAALRESERRFRALAENAYDLIYRFRIDPPAFEFINDSITRLTGYTPEEYYHAPPPLDLVVHAEDLPQMLAALAALPQNPAPVTVRLLHRDGTYTWVEFRIWLVYDAEGRAVAHEALVRDVTAAKEREQGLQQHADEMRDLSARLVLAQEDERRALARELHDEIGQLLTGLNMVLEAPSRASTEQLRAKLHAAQEYITDLTSRVRQLSLDLRPSLLDDLGLLPTLLWHLRRYTEQTGIAVDFKHSGLDLMLPPHIAITAYRIVQESLTNIARYARASSATVAVWARRDQLVISIEDMGVGFDVDAVQQAQRSVGIVGMRERVRLVGGQWLLDSAPNEGTRIFVALPL
jgi:PAS domain S-box-containing protein